MSNSTSHTFSSSSFSYSSSSSSNNGQTTGHRHTEQTYSDPSGTTVHRSSQTLGEPEVKETRRYDSQGRELLENGAGANEQRRIQDVTDEEQAQRDREYEERMEDEYAKREGGA